MQTIVANFDKRRILDLVKRRPRALITVNSRLLKPADLGALISGLPEEYKYFCLIKQVGKRMLAEIILPEHYLSALKLPAAK